MKYNCNNVPYKDKGCHFVAGFLITFLLAFVSPVIGIFAGIAAGVGKELYDQYKYGGFDSLDLFVTFLGVWSGACIYAITVFCIGLY